MSEHFPQERFWKAVAGLCVGILIAVVGAAGDRFVFGREIANLKERVGIVETKLVEPRFTERDGDRLERRIERLEGYHGLSRRVGDKTADQVADIDETP